MKRLVNRLNKFYDQASEDQRSVGLNWYKKAHEHAKQLSAEFNVPLFKVVGVIAALSPNNKWQRNLHDAKLFLANPSLTTKVCTFMGQRQKALEILNYADDRYEVNEILGGRKTQYFFTNILDPESSQETTVDLWMFRAANLDHSDKNYLLIEQAVQLASQEKNILPHQYQAVVWSVIRK